MANKPTRRKGANGAHRASQANDTAWTAVTALDASPQEGWVGLTRDQLELVMQSTTAWLRSLEALRKVQLDMTHLAVQRHQEMQQRLHGVKELSDLVALEVDLMRFDSAAAIHSAQELYDAALRSATEAFEGARGTIDSSHSDGMKAWMQSLQSMMHTGVKPLDDLFGNLWLRPLASTAGQGSAAR
jgi:hypothetical protein